MIRTFHDENGRVEAWGLFENEGGFWIYYEGQRIQIGRFVAYWWPERQWELRVFRFWITGKKIPELKQQTNLWTLRAGPFEFQYWLGA